MQDEYKIEYTEKFKGYLVLRNGFPLWLVPTKEQGNVAIDYDKAERLRFRQNTIDSFRGTYSFLSNFTPCKVTYLGLTYENIEAAFQAQKCPEMSHLFCKLSPKEAKSLGRRVPLRADWEQTKDQIMLKLLQIKFHQEPFKTQLIETGNTFLIEGNTWNDTYWGVCKGQGLNRLGDLLMIIRWQLWCGE